MREEDSRTALLIGREGVNRLKNSKILIFGLGGVGSFAAEALARVGAGFLTLADGDIIRACDINRQLYALHSTVGKYKTEIARERIYDINPDCEVNIVTAFLSPESADSFFTSDYDFCIDAIDGTDAKTAIAVKCREKNIPLIAAMGTGRKLDGDKFVITDIYKTSGCPLCRAMRKKYAAAGLDSVQVLFSTEKPRDIKYAPENTGACAMPMPSISFVPSAAGLRLAEFAVKSLLGNTG